MRLAYHWALNGNWYWNTLCSVELVDSNHVLYICEVLVAEWNQPLTNFLSSSYFPGYRTPPCILLLGQLLPNHNNYIRIKIMEARVVFKKVSNLNLNPELYDSAVQTFKSYHTISMRWKKISWKVVLGRNKCRENHSNKTLYIALVILGNPWPDGSYKGSALLWFL